jgi:hypothetical protein
MIIMPDLLDDTWKIIIPAVPGFIFAVLIAIVEVTQSELLADDSTHASQAQAVLERGRLMYWYGKHDTEERNRDQISGLHKRIAEEQAKVNRLEAKNRILDAGRTRLVEKLRDTRLGRPTSADDNLGISYSRLTDAELSA